MIVIVLSRRKADNIPINFEMDLQYTMILIGCILAVVLVLLLIWYSFPRLNKKKRFQVNNEVYYPSAWAGEPKDSFRQKSVSVKNNTFVDKDGQKINPDEYYQFVVEGNSMQFCGIHDKDLIFVKKGFRITDLNLNGFPYILVLKNSNTFEENPEFKIRRAWGISQYGDDRFEKDVRTIMASESFQEIKKLKGVDGNAAYRGDDQVIDDFLKNRLPIYENRYIKCAHPDIWNHTVVISTTFDTDDKYIHFSIHPIANIIGIVMAAFNVCEATESASKK